MRVRDGVFVAALLVSAASGCKTHNLTFQVVNPASGRLSGGQEVRIVGTGFDKLGTIEVRIGGRPASNVGVMGDEAIVLTTPEGAEASASHPVDISILTSDGRSIVLQHAWTYQAGAAAPGSGGPNEDLRRRL
jgi:hypothetical protein